MKRFIVFALATILALATVASAQDEEFDWRQFEGESIRFLMNQHPFTDFIQPKISEFEELTGIDVTIETFPEDQFRQRRLLEASSNEASLDGYMIMPGQVGAQYLGAGWVRHVDDFVDDPSLTMPDLDLDDFFDGALNTFQSEEGLFGLPLQTESSLLFYRADLFEEAGLEGPPETLEELRDYAETLHDDDMAGFAMRGQGAAATSQIVNLLYSFGGQWLDEDGNSALDSDESVAALEFYADLLRNYGPPGPSNLHWDEVTSLFAQGQVAMIFDANVFRSIMEDPDSAIDEVRENVEYAPLPEGPAGSVPAVLVWGMSVNAASESPEAAWYFIQWAMSKENQVEALLAGVPAARESAWEDEEFQETAPESWIEASRESFNMGQPDWNPPVVAVPEVRDAYGQAIVRALQGDDARTALEQANEEINNIIQRE